LLWKSDVIEGQMKKNRPHFSDIQIVTRQLNVIVYTENNNWAQHLLRPALVILDISLSDHKQLKKACYFLITQGFHLKPVTTEIWRLHFTLPPATFYVSRIKKNIYIFPKPLSWQRPGFFFLLPIAYYHHDYWPLNCKQCKPNRQKSQRFSLVSESLVPMYGMNKFYRPTKIQSTMTLFNQAPQNVEAKIELSRSVSSPNG
jgi:hypothetical protein